MGENMDIPQKVIDLCTMLDDKKAENIVVFDATKMHNVADYFIVATGNSSAQLNGICDYVEEKTLENNLPAPRREGFVLSKWVVLDFDNVLVHLFTKEEREKYSLNKLLGNGKNEFSLRKINSLLLAEKKRKELQEKKEQEKEKRKEIDLQKKMIREQKINQAKEKNAIANSIDNASKSTMTKKTKVKINVAVESKPILNKVEESEAQPSETLGTKKDKKRAKK